jgi:hypothetical protein
MADNRELRSSADELVGQALTDKLIALKILGNVYASLIQTLEQ